MDGEPMKRQLSPAQKAINVYCALVAVSSVIALALFGPVVASAAIIGSIAISGLFGSLVYVFYANRSILEDSNA
jgi:hypothetical protein